MSYEEQLIKQRAEKLDRIRVLGQNPFGTAGKSYSPISHARKGSAGSVWQVAGRVVRKNNQGKLKFFHIKDMTGSIQVMVSKAEVSEKLFELIGLVDLGDLISVSGKLFTTKAGELTIQIQDFEFDCKSLSPPPDKFHGAKDIELLLRQRYLDMIYNEGMISRIVGRAKVVSSLRSVLCLKGYIEVETPVLNNIPGGASAKPFITHHNALDSDFYLRIAPELYLKMLIVGGMERVFEIGRIFRNEGIDQTHNPEFTSVEFYEAHANYRTMMRITQDIVHRAANMIDNEKFRKVEFETREYSDLVKEYDLKSHDPEKLGIKGPFDNDSELVDALFDKIVSPELVNPTFVIHHPAEISPLARTKSDQPEIAERFELYIDGMEVAHGYSELNDPQRQEEIFLKQVNGDRSKIDTNFINALKVGLPPTGGCGIGIDRLCMILLDCKSIRDVISFPTLKPKN